MVVCTDLTKVSDIFHEMYQMWWDSKSSLQRKAFPSIIIKTNAENQRTTDVPPTETPYPFELDRGWASFHRTSYLEIFKKWEESWSKEEYEDPEGLDLAGELVRV